MPQWDYYIWDKRKGRYRHIGAGRTERSRWVKFRGKKKKELLTESVLSPHVLKRELIPAKKEKKKRGRKK